jgi:hypothetical protein
MASRRMISIRLFKDPDIINLSSKDIQLILVGLVLVADDEGREVAHAGLLGREMDYPTEQMEAALQELAANDLLVLYQVGKHRYYQLSRTIWSWQTLGGRFTPSHYPAPPAAAMPKEETRSASSGNARGKPGEKSGNAQGNSRHFPDQKNLTESNRTEDEEEKIPPDCDQQSKPQKVVPFPASRASNADGTERKSEETQGAERAALVQQVARILKVPVTDALARLVADYAPCSSLSLPGEADAAREWIDDPRRNRKRKQMSPAFFRNWLKREQEAVHRRQQSLQALAALPTGTAGNENTSQRTPSVPGPPGPRAPDLMHLADEDQQAEQMKGAKH